MAMVITQDWVDEAERRGLPNLKTTPEALEALHTEKALALFEKYAVFTPRELESRYEVYTEAYETLIGIEAACAVNMAKTMVVPAALSAQREIADTLLALGELGIGSMDSSTRLLREICEETEAMLRAISELEERTARQDSTGMIAGMERLRTAVDALEGLLPDELWPVAFVC